MTTTVNLTDEEVAELQAAMKQNDIGEALKTAMHEYVRYVQRQELMTLSGRVEMQENWQELEEAEFSLPEPLREYIDGKVVERGYGTASEYIRQLIEEDRQRSARQRIDSLLIEGMESGAPIEITDRWRQERTAELLGTLPEDQPS